MYCNNCGAELRDGVAFCEQCGKAINEEGKDRNKIVNKKSKKPLIITLIAAVLLLTIGIVTVVNTGILNPVQHNLNLGYKYLEEGNYEEAILAFEKVLIIDEGKMEAIIGGADAYVGLGEYAQAVDFINKYNKKDSKILWEKIVEIYLEQGDYEEARRIINQANLNEQDYSKYFVSDYITGKDKLNINGNDISVTNNGIYVEGEKKLLSGSFARTFSSNGENIIFFDKSDQAIKNLTIKNKKVEILAKAYNYETTEYPGGYYILGSKDSFIYYNEVGCTSGGGNLCVINMETKQIKRIAADASCFGIFEDEIFFLEGRSDVGADPIYKASLDGNKKEKLVDAVVSFELIDESIYFTQVQEQSRMYYHGLITYDVGAMFDLNKINLTDKTTVTVKTDLESGYIDYSNYR